MDFYSSKRIWVDDSTYKNLNEIFKMGRGLISREKIYYAIIYQWINGGAPQKIGNKIFDDGIYKSHSVWLFIDEILWYQFKTVCSDNGLDKNFGFKLAVNYFMAIFNKEIDKKIEEIEKEIDELIFIGIILY